MMAEFDIAAALLCMLADVSSKTCSLSAVTRRQAVEKAILLVSGLE